jgi:hypothetical protein
MIPSNTLWNMYKDILGLKLMGTYGSTNLLHLSDSLENKR